MDPEILFYFLLTLVAFLYASVGHGGASGYLALMAFFSVATNTMRPTALLLNIFVSAIAFIQYYRSGYFKWHLFFPFALASIPAAFAGGMITVEAGLYKKTLALLLLFSVIKLFGFKNENNNLKKQNFVASLFIGAGIGLLSGMIGIGGGIILSPVLLLLKWADMKQTAAVSAIFIFVNSLAGLAGVMTSPLQLNSSMWLMISFAFAGGLAGSYFGATRLNNASLKKVLAIVLIIASVKLFLA